MAKSKYAPALFEVIGKKDEKAPGLPLPKWWRSKDPQASPGRTAQEAGQEPAASPEAAAVEAAAEAPAGNGAAAGATATSVMEAPAAAGTAQVAPPPSRATPPATDKGGPEWDVEPPPVFRMNDGRVELSLNPVNAAIVGGVLVLTLFLAYQLGGGFSPSKQVAQTNLPAADIEKAKEKPPDPSTLNVKPNTGGTDRNSGRTAAGPGSTQGNAASRTRTNPPPAPPTGQTTPPVPPAGPAPSASMQRVPGLTYVILETFQHEHKAEADQICQWLKTRKNIDTTIEPNGEKWQLVSTQGFEFSKEADKRACGEFVQMVKSWGQDYKKEFKSKALYRMHDPGFKVYKASS